MAARQTKLLRSDQISIAGLGSANSARSATRWTAYTKTAVAAPNAAPTRARSARLMALGGAVSANAGALRIGADLALEVGGDHLAPTAAHGAERAGAARLGLRHRAPRGE